MKNIIEKIIKYINLKIESRKNMEAKINEKLKIEMVINQEHKKHQD